MPRSPGRPGRPLKPDAKRERIDVRMTPETLERMRKGAAIDNAPSLSEWIVVTCLARTEALSADVVPVQPAGAEAVGIG